MAMGKAISRIAIGVPSTGLPQFVQVLTEGVERLLRVARGRLIQTRSGGGRFSAGTWSKPCAT